MHLNLNPLKIQNSYLPDNKLYIRTLRFCTIFSGSLNTSFKPIAIRSMKAILLDFNLDRGMENHIPVKKTLVSGEYHCRYTYNHLTSDKFLLLQTINLFYLIKLIKLIILNFSHLIPFLVHHLIFSILQAHYFRLRISRPFFKWMVGIQALIQAFFYP